MTQAATHQLDARAVTTVRDHARKECAGTATALMADARTGGHDAEAAARLRAQLLDLVTSPEGRTYPEMLEAAVDLLWRHDLNRWLHGAKAIAEVVYGDASEKAAERVKKFEEYGWCRFERWDGKRGISLTLGDAIRVRLEIKSRPSRRRYEKLIP